MLRYCVSHLRRIAFVLFCVALSIFVTNSVAQAANQFISAGTRTINCNSLGVDPGDTITLASGNRGPIRINDCHGTEGNHIVVKNDTTGSGPTVILTDSSEDRVFICEDCSYVTVDGTGKWTGAPAGMCGITVTNGAWTLGRTQCGIQLKCSGGNPSHYIRLQGSTTQMTIKGIEVDAGYPDCDSSNPGTGVSLNDHTYQNRPGEWREGFIFTQNYIHDTVSECFYIGPNQSSSQVDDLQLRNNHISYNITENCGFDSIELKSTIEGFSTIHHNYVKGSGKNHRTISGNVGHGISVYEGGFTDVYNNFVIDTLSAVGGGNCYGNFLQRLSKSRGEVMPTNWYNNVAIDCKGRGFNSGRGSSQPVPNANIYNNTIINAGTGINVGVNDSLTNCFVRNNIIASSGSNSFSQCSSSDNLIGSIASFNFVNPANDDYHLTVNSSSALDAASSGAPSIDHDDIARAQGNGSDIGAFEFDLGERIARPNPPSLVQIQ